jgi:hypothetical protein
MVTRLKKLPQNGRKPLLTILLIRNYKPEYIGSSKN